jgi:hypothetical protein
MAIIKLLVCMVGPKLRLPIMQLKPTIMETTTILGINKKMAFTDR